jgi:hypothetical protein
MKTNEAKKMRNEYKNRKIAKQKCRGRHMAVTLPSLTFPKRHPIHKNEYLLVNFQTFKNEQ